LIPSPSKSPTGVAEFPKCASLVKNGPPTATAGQDVVYTLTVQNIGTSDAALVSLDDPTPAGLTFVSASAPCVGGFPCSLGTIANGATVNVSVTYHVGAGVTGSIVNTATVSSTTEDPAPGNNTSTVGTLVIASADLEAIKTGPAVITAGTPISYSVVVTNHGPSDANSAAFSDVVPAGISGVTASCGTPTGGAACGAVNVTGNNVTSTITTLPSGSSVTFTIGGTGPADGTSLSNTASVQPPAGVTDPAVDVPAFGVVERHGPDQGQLQAGHFVAHQAEGLDHAQRVLPRVEPRNLRDERAVGLDADPVEHRVRGPVVE